MKKIINKALILLLFVGVAISCNNTEDAIFNESTSDRIQNAISEYRELLVSSENGWIIEYYPEESQDIGGFNYGVKFNEDLTVEVVNENDFSKRESNMFDVIANGGPLLTFNTYNALTHFYATPSSASSTGRGGDYEFALTSKTADVITLTGAQSRNKMRMIKLTETPEEYLAKVKNIRDFISLFNGSAINNKPNDVIFSNRHIAFSITGEDPIDMAYHFTPTGIKLYESISINGNLVNEFILDETLNKLTSLDGKVIIDLVKAPLNIHQNWSIDTTNLSDFSADFFNKYVDIYDANGALYGETLLRTFFFGDRTINGITSSGIVFRSDAGSTVWTTQQKLNFSLISDDTELAITKGDQGLNWSFYTHLDPLVDYIIDNAPYTIEQTSPTETKLTSTVDSNAWFIIKL